jgi:hypothetical protein
MTIKPFSQTFSEAVAAIRMADPSLTNLETIHELAWTKAKSEARTMGDPSTSPTPLPAAQQQQFDAIDDNLLESTVVQAQRTALLNKPKDPKPVLNAHFAAALEKIKTSPEMSKDAAMTLARAARDKDRAELIARNAAVSNPAPSDAWARAAS